MTRRGVIRVYHVLLSYLPTVLNKGCFLTLILLTCDKDTSLATGFIRNYGDMLLCLNGDQMVEIGWTFVRLQ